MNVNETHIKTIRDVFNRKTAIEPLDSLIKAISASKEPIQTIDKVAITLDTNVILRLPTHKHGADVIDYLNKENVTLILPEQTLQEFWNNTLSVIDTVGKKLQKQITQLKSEAKVLSDFSPEDEETFNEALKPIIDKFEYIYDEKTLKGVHTLFESLKDKAIVSSIDRAEFFSIAQMRKKTKTPPGFKDDGDGDFFVWAELLYGALVAIEEGNDYNQLILISNDAKKDWVRDGVPHPILSAEVQVLLNKPFHILTLDQFINQLKSDSLI